MNPTMQTIADTLGVSKSTVSLSMRDDPRIAPRTRARVQTTAHQLGYRMNPNVCRLMAALRVGGAKTGERVALVLPAGTEPTPEFLDGLTDRMACAGFGIEVFRLADVTAERLATIIDARGIDAALVVGSEHATVTLARAGTYCVRFIGDPKDRGQGFTAGILLVDQLAYSRAKPIQFNG